MEKNKKLIFHLLTNVQHVMDLERNQDQNRFLVLHAEDMVKYARRAMDAARTPSERALACNRELGGWDGLGRYTRSLEAAQRGLRESPIDGELRRALESNLANAYYTLWHLVESRATANELLARFESEPPATEWDRCTHAFAKYVLGHTHRRLIDAEPEHAAQHAEAARSILTEATSDFEVLAKEVHECYEGVARTCRGGVLEAEVSLGSKDAREALAVINDALNDIIDLEQVEGGDLLVREVEKLGFPEVGLDLPQAGPVLFYPILIHDYHYAENSPSVNP